jgi:hypothetical protein
MQGILKNKTLHSYECFFVFYLLKKHLVSESIVRKNIWTIIIIVLKVLNEFKM